MFDTKSDSQDRPSAPNYTQACIVMFGVNLMWILCVIWAVWGILAVLATGFVVKKGIDWIEWKRG